MAPVEFNGRPNQRLQRRYPASAVPAITGVRLSPGGTVTLVNVSTTGVLVEGSTRLAHGTRVAVFFEGALQNQIHANIVRCQVSTITGGGALKYHIALIFEGRLDLPVNEAALAAAAAASTAESAAQPESNPAPIFNSGPPGRVQNRW